jgi:N-acetylmuramoyl-L-alanine amidase
MKRKLFIDTGHSVKYPGANGIKSEVDWVRLIAEKLYPLLDTTYWDIVKVPDVYPGETSPSTSLIKRIKWINDHGDSNDVLVSIHANSAERPVKRPGESEQDYQKRLQVFLNKARGVETCYYSGSQKSKDEALRLSHAVSTATGMPLFNDGLMGDAEGRFGRLGMIRDTQPFALLVECGFVSNKEDMLIDQTLVARGIANYLNSYNHMPETRTTQSDELSIALQELNKRQVIEDISNPHRQVSLAEVALIVYRNDHNPKN